MSVSSAHASSPGCPKSDQATTTEQCAAITSCQSTLNTCQSWQLTTLNAALLYLTTSQAVILSTSNNWGSVIFSGGSVCLVPSFSVIKCTLVRETGAAASQRSTLIPPAKNSILNLGTQRHCCRTNINLYKCAPAPPDMNFVSYFGSTPI